MKNLILKLYKNKTLNEDEFVKLINLTDDKDIEFLAQTARLNANKYYGRNIYIRGLIEISNYCKNNCYYCGIRCQNKLVKRYRLSKEEILKCCEKGHSNGFKTFVLQGGEDIFFDDDVLCDIVKSIKDRFHDCAVTISLGERSFESYKKLKESGADRYLLRHEAINKELYNKMHPQNMSYDNRIRCLNDLKSLGYQVGCGFMVGAPYQTDNDLAKDLIFLSKFKPQMVGIGPFIKSNNTPFEKFKSGSAKKTLILISLIRLILPSALIPSTTALATIDKNNTSVGILHGANVVMPNLSPDFAKENYSLYNKKERKIGFDVDNLNKQFNKIDYQIIFDRGDHKDERED